MKKLICSTLICLGLVPFAAGCKSSNKESFWHKNSKTATQPQAGQLVYPGTPNYQGAIADPLPNMGLGGPPAVRDVRDVGKSR